jgi:hypothetical protein
MESLDSLTKEIYYTILNETAKNENIFGWIKNNNSLTGLLKKMHNLLYNIDINDKYFVENFEGTTKNKKVEFSNFNNFLKLKNGNEEFQSNVDELFTNIEIYENDSKSKSNISYNNEDVINVITLLYNFYLKIYNNNNEYNDIKLRNVINEIRNMFNLDNINVPDTIIKTISTPSDILNNHLYMINELNNTYKEELNEKLFIFYNFIKILYQILQLNILISIYYCHIENDLSIAYNLAEIEKNDEITSINNRNNEYKILIDNAINGINNSIDILKNTYHIATGLLINITKRDNISKKYTFEYSHTNANLLLQMIYENIEKDKHVLISQKSNQTFLITSNIEKTSKIDANNNTIVSITMILDKPIPVDETDMRINFKRAHIRKLEFENKKDKLKKLNKKLDEKNSDYKKALNQFENISSETNKLQIISFVFYSIFIFTLVVLLLGEFIKASDNKKSIFSLIMLILITILYVIYILMYNGTERFNINTYIFYNFNSSYDENDNKGILTTNCSNLKKNINNKCFDLMKNIYSYYSIVALNEVYLNIFNVLEKDKQKLLLFTKTKEYKKVQINDYSNSIWLEQYLTMTYITMIYYLSVIIIIYYLLSVKYSEGVTYWLISAIIGIIIVIFNYYRMISQRVRTKSKNFYWSK